jgi:hypothetical protein
MRDFSWQYFSITGDVDAYLLYKKIDEEHDTAEAKAEEETTGPQSNEMLQ